MLLAIVESDGSVFVVPQTEGIEDKDLADVFLCGVIMQEVRATVRNVKSGSLNERPSFRLDPETPAVKLYNRCKVGVVEEGVRELEQQLPQGELPIVEDRLPVSMRCECGRDVLIVYHSGEPRFAAHCTPGGEICRAGGQLVDRVMKPKKQAAR